MESEGELLCSMKQKLDVILFQCLSYQLVHDPILWDVDLQRVVLLLYFVNDAF